MRSVHSLALVLVVACGSAKTDFFETPAPHARAGSGGTGGHGSISAGAPAGGKPNAAQAGRAGSRPASAGVPGTVSNMQTNEEAAGAPDGGEGGRIESHPTAGTTAAGSGGKVPAGTGGVASAGGRAGSAGRAGGGGAGAIGGLGGAGTSGSAGSAGAAGSGGTAGTSAGGGTAGGGGMEVFDCSHEVTLTTGLLTDFDSYDGVESPSSFRFTFNAPSAPVTGALTADGDGTGSYSLAFITRANGYAVSATNPRASDWGGGVILTLHCLDARAFSGLSFRVKGSTPAGTAEVGLTADGASVGYQFTMPADWTLMQVPFSAFQGGSATPDATTNGAAISAVTFSSQLHYSQNRVTMQWEADPGAIEVSVDDVGFY
jgi:hypothetical protein